MINRVYRLVLFLLNKENKGYISPEEFNELAEKVQSQIVNDLLIESNKAAMRTNKGNNNVTIVDNELTIDQRLAHLITIKRLELQREGDKSLAYKPKDLLFITSRGILFYPVKGPATEIERLNIAKRPYTLATTSFIDEEFPVYFDHDLYLEILPALTGSAEITYLRKLKKPKWTYRLIKTSPTAQDTTPMFNNADPLFQDFDLHESEFSNIVLRMLPELGLSLRERDVMEYGEKLKQDEEITNTYQQ